jgi:hypothetical protein
MRFIASLSMFGAVSALSACGGDSAPVTVTTPATPTASLSASPIAVAPGGSSMLSWS